MTRWLVVVMGFALHLVSIAHAATSEAVIDNGVARLAVEWAAPVVISTDRRDKAVEIQSSRPFPPRIEAQLATLRPLITSARLDETATKLELSPAASVQIEAASPDDRSLVITAAPGDLSTLGVRLGRHTDFERIVIEPVAEQQVRLRQDGQRVTLSLPGRLAPADRQRLRQIAGLARVETAGNQLVLELAPGAFLKDLFVEPDRQVLDVYGEAPKASADAGASNGRASGPAETSAAAAAVPADLPTTTAATEPLRETAAAAPALSAERSATALGRVPAPWTAPSFSRLAIDAVTHGDTLELRFAWPEPVPAAVFVRGERLWVGFAAEHDGIALDAERFSAAARGFVTTLREEAHPEATLIRFDLVAPSDIDVAREGAVWHVRLATAREGEGSRSGVPPRFEPVATGGLVMPELDAVAALTDPVIGDEIGIGMALAVTGRTERPARFVGLRLQPAAQGALWQHLGETSREPLWTEAGLHLGPEEGVARGGMAHNPPEPPVALLQSLPMALDPPVESPGPVEPRERSPSATTDPGVAHPAADAGAENPATTADATTRDGAIAADVAPAPAEPKAVGEPPGRVGETGSLRRPAAAAAAAPPSAAGPLDLARFRAAPGRRFWDQRSRLLQAADNVESEHAVTGKLELARLHVANGLGPEAVSLLAALPQPGPLDGPSPERRALEGVAHFLAGRYEAALQHLDHPELRSDSETALWRGATLAALERWDDASADWQAGQAWLGDYEPGNQAALAEPGIMLLLQTGRIDEAFALLDQIASLSLPARSSERLRELEAVALERDGAIDEARAIWRDLAAEGSPEARSRALMSLALSDLQTGLIEADEAIDRLVADSVHWRGQSDEIAKRRRLAAVQRKAGYIEEALATLQEAVAGDPPAALTAAVTDDMTAIVEGLFDDLAAGERSATATLLLYRRYAELLPPGAAGDAKVETLAAALSELGLDDAAADSLRSRLARSDARDAGRAALGYALASLLARNGDRRGAMSALVDSTPVEAIDDRLAEARRALFVDIGRSGDAPAAGAERSLEAIRERARLAFDRGAWPEVLAATGTSEPELPTAGRLDPATTELVLMAATASRQLGDHAAVERLVATYGDRLATASDAAVLGLLAGNAHFAGSADDVLGEASSYIRTMRDAVADMPAL